MDFLRFSTLGLLRWFVWIGLLVGTLRAFAPGTSDWVQGMANLCCGTLVLSILFCISEHSAARVLLLTLGLYAWGLGCLAFCAAFHPGGAVRILMAVVGVAYMFWAWMPLEPRVAVLGDRW